MKHLPLLCLPALAVLVGSAPAQGKAEAIRAAVAPHFFSSVKVLTKDSCPPQFDLRSRMSL